MTHSDGFIKGADTTRPTVLAPASTDGHARRRGGKARPVPLEVGSARSPDIVFSVHCTLAEIEDEWRAFEATADRTPFQSFEWLKRWQGHIGAPRGTRPAIVFARAGDGRLLFIVPLAVERGRTGRRLVWLGSDQCDYNAPLLAPDLPGHTIEWRSIWGSLKRTVLSVRSLRFDFVDLTKMPEKIGDQPNPLLVLGTQRNANDAHVATLGEDWEAFYREKRSSSSRKVQRKQLNRLADFGEVRFRPCETPDEARETIETLFAQKRRALQRMGADDIFERASARAFYEDVTTAPALSGMVHVSHLDVGDDVAAASVGLIFGNRYYLILSSYNDGPMSRHGPGRAHLLELLRFATERQLTEFDFTIGNEPYKLDWCDIQVPLHDHLSAQTLPGAVTRPVIAMSRSMRRSIRNNPKAWELFSAARRWLGRGPSSRTGQSGASSPADGDADGR